MFNVELVHHRVAAPSLHRLRRRQKLEEHPVRHRRHVHRLGDIVLCPSGHHVHVVREAERHEQRAPQREAVTRTVLRAVRHVRQRVGAYLDAATVRGDKRLCDKLSICIVPEPSRVVMSRHHHHGVAVARHVRVEGRYYDVFRKVVLLKVVGGDFESGVDGGFLKQKRFVGGHHGPIKQAVVGA